MLRRRRRPKCRVIRLYTTKMPEIMPWLDAQENQSMSVYMLIRMVQHIYGNVNWPDLAQALANKSIEPNLMGSNAKTINKPQNIYKQSYSSKPEISQKTDMTTSKKPTRPKHQSIKSTMIKSHSNDKPKKKSRPKKSPSKIKPKQDDGQADNSLDSKDLKNLLGL